jgi:hypothetical protein
MRATSDGIATGSLRRGGKKNSVVMDASAVLAAKLRKALSPFSLRRNASYSLPRPCTGMLIVLRVPKSGATVETKWRHSGRHLM